MASVLGARISGGDPSERVAEHVEVLAEFVAAATFEDLPYDVVRRARLLLADTVAVILRGSVELEMQNVYRSLRGATAATVLNRYFQKADTTEASVANAMAGCFLELDGGSRPSGHPAIHVLPTALALTQSLGRSGMDLINTLVVGYEAQARVQLASRLRFPVHPHGTLGHVGAAVAMAKVLRYRPDDVVQAINMSAGLAGATSWRACLTGATVRNAYAALSAHTAGLTRMLVESGFKGDDGAVEETFGRILGDGFSPGPLSEGLGSDYLIMQGYFKFHSACALIHPALDAVADALGSTRVIGSYPPVQGGLSRTEDVKSVRVVVSQGASRLAKVAAVNGLSAKFSIPHAVATHIAHGSCMPENMTDSGVTDLRVQDIVQKIVVAVDPEFDKTWPSEAKASITIEMQDGGTLHGECSNPFGSPANPASEEDLRAKFLNLVDPVIARSRSRGLWDNLVERELPEDVSDLLYAHAER